MALDEQMVQQQEQSLLSDEEERDLQISVMLAENLIDEGGWKVIQQAEQSSDPAVVVGQFLLQLGAQLGESLPFEISPRIMLAEGGWLEQVSDYLQEEYGVPKQVMDRAEIFIASSAQAMAQQQQQGVPQQAQPTAPAAPAMPQEGMV